MKFKEWLVWALLFYTLILIGIGSGGAMLLTHAYLPPDVVFASYLGIGGGVMLIFVFLKVAAFGARRWKADPSGGTI